MRKLTPDALVLGGREQLEALMAGPGASALGVMLGMRLSEIGDGFAQFVARPTPEHYNPGLTVHGGYAATLIDSALGCAVQTKLAAGTRCGTIELKVNYVRAVTVENGLLTCRAEVLHCGRRLATAEAQVVDAQGKLVAHGSGSFMIQAEA
jgi:acyl-CoA thioesterase